MITLNMENIAEGAELKIYDVSGKLVRFISLPNNFCMQPTVVWDGSDQNGHCVHCGIYFVCHETNMRTTTEKLIKIN
jgi:flagellar hook assembly protein FlgD